MSKVKEKAGPSGVFLPGEDLAEYLERRGDLRAVFDRVHRYFFENPGALDLRREGHKTGIHRSRKGGSHA